jgi:predicted XRE-type DNA-binding protein
MPSARETNKPGHITTGNVLEDLGFSAEEIREIEIQHDLWVPIRAEIEARKLTQRQVAKVLQIHQPDASLLLRGQIARFSITRLLQFADRLGLAVTLAVSPKTEAQKPKSIPRVPSRLPGQRKKSTKPTADSQRGRSRATA